jgi:MFS family permease
MRRRDSRGLTSLCSGLLMYGVCWAVAWLLADINLPADMFPHHLLSRGSVGTVLGEAGAIALLLFVIALVWSYFTVRSPKLGRRPTTAWCLAGLGLAWFAWLLIGVFQSSDIEAVGEQSLSVMLFSATQPPLWGLLNSIALLLGLGLAGVLATKQYRKLGGGQGRSRTINSSYARRRKKSSRKSAAASAEPEWADTRPLLDLPEARQGLHLPLGQTGR